jgi:hypothetical protein
MVISNPHSGIRSLLLQILQSLLMEDDSNPDVWHLLTLALYRCGSVTD